MARLFGLIGNRADLASRVRAPSAGAPRKGARTYGLGIGFYQGGEVLMRRRPIDEREIIDVAQNAGDLAD